METEATRKHDSSAEPPGAFVHRLRVRYVECDMQSVVFNAHYYTWMDIAHTELWEDAVGSLSTLGEEGLDFVVAESSARFRAPAHYGDVVVIAVTLEPLSNGSMVSHHEIRRGEDLLVHGRVRHACVERETHRKHSWPQHVRDALARYVVDDGSAER